jgi:dihydroorotase
MEKIGMTFLIHGEEADPEIDVFDREAVFIERRLIPMTRDFPGLRIVLEHLSSREGVEFVRSAAPQLGGTITPYHLMLTRTDWLGYGLRPYMYCMPVIKRREDRDALRKAATSGAACYFLGTDSAPHPVARKLTVVGAAGLFNSPVAIESYAQVFAEENALDKLEAFASLNGPKHYRLPPNEDSITLERSSWTAPEDIKVDGPEERALVHRGGETIQWQVAAN